jgi:hypothetical protein
MPEEAEFHPQLGVRSTVINALCSRRGGRAGPDGVIYKNALEKHS